MAVLAFIAQERWQAISCLMKSVHTGTTPTLPWYVHEHRFGNGDTWEVWNPCCDRMCEI